jgi:SAM-dependent methyltransferase
VDERDDWSPLSEVESAVQIEAVLALCAERGWARVLDLGSGDGRVARPLDDEGVRVLALDRNAGGIAALKAAQPRIEALVGDFLDAQCALTFADGARADAAMLLGNTLMEIHDVERASALFARLREALEPGGAIVIDNFVLDIWADVADGAWQEGVSEDGEWQMVWTEGDEVIALRRGDEVDAEGWEVRESDRLLRLWSLGSLRLLGMSSGWAGPVADRSGALLVFGTT